MVYIYYALMAVVIGGHFFFSYLQICDWETLVTGLSTLTETEAQKAQFLGNSIGSYNAAIGFGLIASFWLQPAARRWVQCVVLGLIVATAIVGVAGTGSMEILGLRLAPAALALAVLLYRKD